MAAGLNKVMLIGRVGKEPEVKSTPNGMLVAKFSLATDESYKDRNQQKVEKTEWHNIVAWGKLAEVVEKYIGKGQLLYVEGSLKTDSWEDQSTGAKKYRTGITVRELRMLEYKKDSDSEARSNSGRVNSAAAAVDDDEEIPF